MALNNISIMGRLVADPELRTVGEDTHVASCRIAVDRDRKNREGERETDFIPVVAWRHDADFLAQYFSKGDMMVVNGRLQTRMYTDKDGNNRSAFDVVADHIYFGSSKKKDGGNTNSTKPSSQQAAYDTDDGDLPF